MSKQANPTVIGGFVLGALTLVVIAILVFGGGALFRERVPMVTYFPGSVQGLSVGAGVQFEGVTVGRVTGIELSFSPDTGIFSVPVTYEVWPDSVRVLGAESDDSPAQILQRLVKERGLHARLESVSFVTGQYMIALQLVPGRPPRLIKDPEDVVEVPSIEATRDRMSEMLENLRLDDLVNEASLTLASVRQLIGSGEMLRLIETLNATLDEARILFGDLDREVQPLARRMDSTLEDFSAMARAVQAGVVPVTENIETVTEELALLVRRVDEQVVPLSGATLTALGEVEGAMRSLGSLTGDASGTRVRLDRFLVEASAAARSLRDLADYLERHPDALLRGKR
ncbi:MlaD family protein [Thiocapsa roseopersicina]|uniref:Paraquat-inducible protein B n=1 Tax=Thiocapsa roseopersicina TaxID=1058 RepID=A0A1H2QY55_THIRO|nr:MlaD family protein [Thiocapsa roseopersicina]SDW12132.1 paraquat-inducible protein B [Thiocapsa roseopersicina]